jgi:hypothetical protein
MYQPQPLPPGTESWGERYGVIGVVAALALTGLALALRTFLNERKEERTRVERDQADHEKLVTALNEKLVEVAREGHRETLKLLSDQQTAHEQRFQAMQAAHEQRFQALLDRTMSESRENAAALRALNQTTADALNGVVKRLKGPE